MLSLRFFSERVVLPVTLVVVLYMLFSAPLTAAWPSTSLPALSLLLIVLPVAAGSVLVFGVSRWFSRRADGSIDITGMTLDVVADDPGGNPLGNGFFATVLTWLAMPFRRVLFKVRSAAQPMTTG